VPLVPHEDGLLRERPGAEFVSKRRLKGRVRGAER
jgi:hypothetical protein